MSEINAIHPQARASTSNGRRFLHGIDGRTYRARRFRDIALILLSTFADPTPSQRTIARSAASLQIALEDMHAQQARGEVVPAADLVKTTGALRRCLRDLALASEDSGGT